MAAGDVLYKGFFVAQEAGQLASPDVRFALALSGFSYNKDSVNLDDGTLDEYDGVGYVRYDAASVVTEYVDADDEWQARAASGSFGDPVAPASEPVAHLVAILNVDGTAANDIILGSRIDGIAGLNGNNGAFLLTIPGIGFFFGRQAA